jgi:ligand-binding sensor domain-containing protein
MQFMILSTRFWRSFSLACAVWCGLTMEARAQIHQFRNYTAADEDGLSDNFVFSIQQDRQGRLWFATSAGVSRYDGTEFKNFTITDGLVNNAVREIYEDRQGRLWFSTTGGVSCLENGAASNAKPVFKNYTRLNGLPHDSVEWVLEDKVGNFWIATRGGGLSYFDGRSFHNYGEADGLTAKTVWVLCLDRKGTLWIGSSEGLHSFDGKTFKNYSTREGLPSGSVVSSLLVDNRDRLWVGTRKGLGWFDGTRFHPMDLGIRGGDWCPGHVAGSKRGSLAWPVWTRFSQTVWRQVHSLPAAERPCSRLRYCAA